MKVGEVATTTTGYEDFLADPVGMFQHGNSAAAFTGFDCAHQSSRAASENNCIKNLRDQAKSFRI